MSRQSELVSEMTYSEPTATPPVVRVFGDLRFHTDGDILALAFTPEGELWSIEEPGVLRNWDPATGRPRVSTFLSDLETMWHFSRDARWAASASDELSLWEVASGEMRFAIPQPSWVNAVALRGDPFMVATGHDDGMVRVWGGPGRRLLREMGGHDRPISALALSSDGHRLVSAGEDGILCIWEVNSGKRLGTLRRHTDHIQAVAWHPRGSSLFSIAWDRTARVWNTDSFEPVIILNTHANQLTAMAVSPDGQLLACADSGWRDLPGKAESQAGSPAAGAGPDLTFAISIWDPQAGKELHVLREHENEINCLAFSPDGHLLASAGADRVIHFWDPHHGRLMARHDRPVLGRTSLATSPDGARLASSCGGAGLQVWNTATGLPVFLAVEAEQTHVLAGSPDGRWLALAGADQIRVVDANTGQIQKILRGQAEPAGALTWSPDSTTVASASASDGTVWLWNAVSGEPFLVIPEAASGCTVESLAFHPQGVLLAVGGIDWLATGGSDGAICLWNIQERAPVATLNRGTTFLTFHPTGRWLASAALDHGIGIWAVDERRLVLELAGHTEEVTCLAYSPDGKWLVSGSDDRTLRVWHAVTGELLAEHNLATPIGAVEFSPDGKYVYTGNGNTTSYQLKVRVLLDEEPAINSDQK